MFFCANNVLPQWNVIGLNQRGVTVLQLMFV